MFKANNCYARPNRRIYANGTALHRKLLLQFRISHFTMQSKRVPSNWSKNKDTFFELIVLMTQIHFDRWQPFFFQFRIFQMEIKSFFCIAWAKQQIVYISGYRTGTGSRVTTCHKLSSISTFNEFASNLTFRCQEHFNLLSLNKRIEFLIRKTMREFSIWRETPITATGQSCYIKLSPPSFPLPNKLIISLWEFSNNSRQPTIKIGVGCIQHSVLHIY